MIWSITDENDERFFATYDMYKLRMDEFYLNINIPSDQAYYLYTLNKECFEVNYL